MDFDSGKSSSLHCWTRGTTGCMDIDVSKDDDVCFFNKDEGAAGKLRLRPRIHAKKNIYNSINLRFLLSTNSILSVS